MVASVVVPTAEYVRFAGHYGFRPDFCAAADPESKGIVENLVGYAKAGLMVPQAPFGGLAAANVAAAAWCAEVNGVVHSEICAVPAGRLVIERELLGPLPSLRASIGKLVTRKVDRLSCVRFASARYSVPARLIGTQVRLCTDDGRLLVIMTAAGEVVAGHILVAPGEASVRDEHYGGPRSAALRRDALDEAVLAEPTQVVGGLAGCDRSWAMWRAAEVFAEQAAQVLVKEPAGMQPGRSAGCAFELLRRN